MTEAKRLPKYEPPAILFPYNKMGKSAAGVACDTTGGKFGPFRQPDVCHRSVLQHGIAATSKR